MRIVLVDDEPLFLSMLERMIAQIAPEHEIAGSYTGAEQALASLPNDKPDLLISDIAMQGMDGLHMLDLAREVCPDALRVVLSSYPDFSYALHALKSEVMDYLLKPPHPKQLRELFDKASALTEQRKQARPEHAVHGAASGETQSAARPLSEHERIVQTVERYLEQHYRSAVSHQTLEAEFGLVGSYINKLFKKHKGSTLMDYLAQYRIEQAKILLKEKPTLMLKEVASLVGFDDPLYFSRVFRKITGISPSEFAKR
ncbi:response regulator transcription factor [Paenibacillus cymbidii]|uniref:response regulator transcription factor n=1 Tax=Paenibacillus cymbidii TaxID=1639034 RepID=UPI0010803EEF|nr:helix-turn-helix domain-containing protein [Paenibacillus cymbidii]